MIYLGEHIEDMVKVFRENELPLDPDDIAEAVLDTACEQGLLSEEEAGSDLAHKQVADETRYLMGVD